MCVKTVVPISNTAQDYFRKHPEDYADPDDDTLAGTADEEGPIRQDYDYSQAGFEKVRSDSKIFGYTFSDRIGV